MYDYYGELKDELNYIYNHIEERLTLKDILISVLCYLRQLKRCKLGETLDLVMHLHIPDNSKLFKCNTQCISLQMKNI